MQTAPIATEVVTLENSHYTPLNLNPMKTIATRLRVLGLGLFFLSLSSLLFAFPSSLKNCSTNILIKQSEGSGEDCPEKPILVINPAELNASFGQHLLLVIQPGNYRIWLDKNANGFTMPIPAGKYTFTTSVIGISSCEPTIQELEIVQTPTLYDIQFKQFEFSCEGQAAYKVGISPAFDRATFGVPMTISLLPDGPVFEVSEHSNALLLTLPAGQYQLISESPTDPSCRRVQQIAVIGGDGMDVQAPIFTSSFCDSFISSTTPACVSEIHYLVEATDNCGPVTITNDYNDQLGSSFADLFPIGTHELTFTATDEAGNQSNCTVNFSISFEGVANAYCVANAVITVGEDAKRYLTVDELTISNPSGEYCDEVFRIDPPYVSCDDVGTQLVKVFQKGNTEPLCEANITVESQYEFVLACNESTYKANENRDGVCGAVVSVELELASTGCSQDFTIRNDHNAETGLLFTDFFPIGRHEVTFFLEKKGVLAATCTQSIIVEEDPSRMACLQPCLPEIVQTGNTFEFNVTQESWKLGSQNNGFMAQEDDFTFISFPMTGDGSIVAKVNQMSPTARAGVMMRENCNPDSRFIAVLLRLFSRNAYQRHRIETHATSLQVRKRFRGSRPKWVKLKRKGNNFYSYASTNGYSWRLLFKTTLPMGEDLQWGLMVESSTKNAYATATFEHIQVTREATNNLANQRSNTLNSQLQTQVLNQPKTSSEPGIELSIFPNPTSGQVSVVLPNLQAKRGTIEVLDMNGRLIWKRVLESIDGQLRRFDWRTFQAGIYLVAIKQEGQSPSTQRIAIKP